MNKKVLILTGLVLILITVNFFNLYIKSEKELKNEYKNYVSFYKTANDLITLKNKYSEKPLKILKSVCTVNSNKITCKNLSQDKINLLNGFLKSNIKIKKFKIINNNGKYDFYAEIAE